MFVALLLVVVVVVCLFFVFLCLCVYIGRECVRACGSFFLVAVIIYCSGKDNACMIFNQSAAMGHSSQAVGRFAGLVLAGNPAENMKISTRFFCHPVKNTKRNIQNTKMPCAGYICRRTMQRKIRRVRLSISITTVNVNTTDAASVDMLYTASVDMLYTDGQTPKPPWRSKKLKENEGRNRWSSLLSLLSEWRSAYLLQTELETKIRGLVNREKHSSAELDITRDELRNLEKHERTSGVEREKVRVCLVGMVRL